MQSGVVKPHHFWSASSKQGPEVPLIQFNLLLH